MNEPGRSDKLLTRIAEPLGLRVVAPLAGGEFGALHVLDDAGRHLVLKAMGSTLLAQRFARGAEMAERMRSLGYPAPYYAGTGTVLDASWSLQELLPGQVPDVMTEAHALQLIDLVRRHAGAAPRGDRTAERRGASSATIRLARLEACDETRALATELGAVLQDLAQVDLLRDGVVHGDFHERNYLVAGDRITGVFDWDFADTGDWRSDLVTLAFWSALLPDAVPPAVSQIIISRMRELCPRGVLALFAARTTLRQLEYDVRVHPEHLATIIPGIETKIAPWWRVSS